MTDNRILQAIIDGQAAIREEIKKLDVKVDSGFKETTRRFDKTDERIDKLGLQLANLEDDAPTVAAFDNLEKKVKKLEHHFVSA